MKTIFMESSRKKEASYESPGVHFSEELLDVLSSISLLKLLVSQSIDPLEDRSPTLDSISHLHIDWRIVIVLFAVGLIVYLCT